MPDISAKNPATEDAALRAVDALLVNAGLDHGRRRASSSSRRERQPRHPRQVVHPPQGRRKTAKSKLDVLRAPALTNLDWLVHGFSTRTGGTSRVFRPAQRSGELNLGFAPADEKSAVEANRLLYLQAVSGGLALPLVTLRQIHSSLTRTVALRDAAPQAIFRADGMMTGDAGVLLGIQTADCIPVLVADRKKRTVAAFHAGWRGTLKRIVEAGVGRMRLEFGSRPEDLVAAIGPGIGQCCYAVGDEVRGEFESQFVYAADLFCEVYDSDPIKEKYPLLFLTARAPGHSDTGPRLHLDLVEANRRQLLDAGLSASAISLVGGCTSCANDRYFSYRAENGFTGRMLAVIGIRE